MTLMIKHYTLGPLGTNSYLIADPETRTAAVIDPAEGSTTILNEANEQGLSVDQIWLTHTPSVYAVFF